MLCLICDCIQIKTLSRGLFSYQLSAISYQLSTIIDFYLSRLPEETQQSVVQGVAMSMGVE